MWFLKRLVNIFFWLMLLAFGVSFLSHSAATLLDARVGAPLRASVSYITGKTALPIFEIMLLALPVLLIALLAGGRISGVITVAKLLVAAYIITLGIPAKVPPRVTVSTEPTQAEYTNAARLVCERLSALPTPTGDLITPAALAASEYVTDKLCIESAVIPTVKASLVPNIVADMGIVAYYAFPTAEIVVCDTAPDFLAAFSAAHEAMHFFGISSEDEANLFALAALLNSGNQALEYCAYLGAFVYVGAVLCTEDRDTYDEIYAQLPDFAREMLDLRNSFVKQGEGRLGALSDTLNDVAITLRDPRGSASYSYTSRLIVEYLLE